MQLYNCKKLLFLVLLVFRLVLQEVNVTLSISEVRNVHHECLAEYTRLENLFISDSTLKLIVLSTVKHLWDNIKNKDPTYKI